jgi:RsiW-degrading membrane proteinase PrsW (M82 family)
MRCPHCGRETPAGHYCAYCGAHLAAAHTRHDPRSRRQAFAANPSEHVYHPSVVSTLFPHLAPARIHQVRWLLAGAALVVFLIGFGRFVPLAIVLAALLVPVLYLLYFYDVELYEDEPLPVLGATFLLSAILGFGLSVLLYRPILTDVATTILPHRGPSAAYVLLSAVVLPVVGLLLLLVGPAILLFTRRKFDEVLDGFAFGAASGLGFAAAQSIVFSWLLITGPFQRGGPAYSWALPVIRVALLAPLLNATAAGIVCAALWLQRDPQAPRRAMGPLASPVIAFVVAALGLLAPALLSIYVPGQVLNLVWYGAALVALLLVARHVLHAGLVEKAHAIGHGGTMKCPHCFHDVPDTPFCPNCGLALRSTANPARRPLPAAPGPEEEAAH